MPAGDSAAGSNEILSQSEVERLLSQVAEDQTAPTAGTPGTVTPAASQPPPASGPRRHDFRGASLLTSAELRRARLRHDEFARSLATRLSIHLRMEFGAQVAALQTVLHPKFIDGLANPIQLTLFRVEPLSGVGLLAIPTRLSLSVLDRLLGGPGNAPQAESPLTDVDLSLLDLVVQLILKEWSQHVAGLPEAQPQIVGHETNPRFLPTASGATQMLLLALDTRLGDCAEQIQLVLPFAAVETLLRQPEVPIQFRKAGAAPPDGLLPRWHTGLGEVSIKLSAGWDGVEITAQQLAQLRVGDVLPLEPDRFNRVQVRLARVSKFVGRLGSSNSIRAVELTAKLTGTAASSP